MAETTPVYQETATSNIPEWARPYAQDLLGFGAALTFPKFNPQTGRLETGFQPYGGELVAGLSPLQQQAMGDISQMQVSPQTAQATGFTGLAALQAQNLAQYNPLAAQQYYDAPQYREQGISSFADITAPEATSYQIGGPERVGAERFGLGAMQEYMSPYMQGVVERQKRGAVQDYLKQLPGMGAASVRAGARGGSREALLESEARRGLSERLGDIEATGLQQAYQQAAGQFGQDRAAQMQAALANQAVGLQTGQTNLQALINQAQFGAGQGMQAQQLNQAALQQAQQQRLAQQQVMNQLAQQDAMTRAQYGLAGTQLGEQSRQFGAGLGLQGLQQQLAAAGQLGQLGQQQYQQQAGILGAQLGAGAQQQALGQQQLTSNYQRFVDEMQYPYKQLEFFSNLLRGTPSSAQTTNVYTPAPSPFGQIYGLTGGLGGLFGGLGS
jgi:hypothetical protein